MIFIRMLLIRKSSKITLVSLTSTRSSKWKVNYQMKINKSIKAFLIQILSSLALNIQHHLDPKWMDSKLQAISISTKTKKTKKEKTKGKRWDSLKLISNLIIIKDSTIFTLNNPNLMILWLNIENWIKAQEWMIPDQPISASERIKWVNFNFSKAIKAFYPNAPLKRKKGLQVFSDLINF